VVIEPSLKLDDSLTKERLSYEKWDSSSKDGDVFLEKFLDQLDPTKADVSKSPLNTGDNPYKAARVISLGTGLHSSK
jgi:hypothetical protein